MPLRAHCLERKAETMPAGVANYSAGFDSTIEISALYQFVFGQSRNELAFAVRV